MYFRTSSDTADLLAAGGGGAFSRKIKKNIDYSGVDPELALQFKPVTFDSKADDLPYIGFIAEDMMEIDPRLAIDGDLPGLEMNAIVSALTASTQKQQQRIETVETENAELRSLIEQTNARLTKKTKKKQMSR